VRDRGLAWLPQSEVVVMRYTAMLRSRTGCAPTEVGKAIASTRPSPQPSPRRGEGGKRGGIKIPVPSNEAALSPLRYGALRFSRSVRGSNERIKAGLGRPMLLSHVLLRALALKGHFLWVTFLLGQQKKSDSAAGRSSKRPLRKRHARESTATEGQSFASSGEDHAAHRESQSRTGCAPTIKSSASEHRPHKKRPDVIRPLLINRCPIS